MSDMAETAAGQDPMTVGQDRRRRGRTRRAQDPEEAAERLRARRSAALRAARRVLWQPRPRTRSGNGWPG